MINFGFAVVLVGLPAFYGSHTIIKNFGRRNASHGISALLYAAVLCGFFVYWLPQGNLLLAEWKLKMPTAFALGCIAGFISGVVQRRRPDP